MNEQMNEQMNEWKNEWKNEWMNEKMNGEWTMNERMNKWMWCAIPLELNCKNIWWLMYQYLFVSGDFLFTPGKNMKIILILEQK